MQWEFILSKEALLLPEAIPHPEVLLLDVECGCVILTDARCCLTQQAALVTKHPEAFLHPVAS